MNNVSIYGILTTKKICHKTLTLSSFASHIRQLVSPLKDSSSSQATYLDSIFHCTSVPFWKCPDGSFAMFIGGGTYVLRGKKPNGNAENEVSMTCYTP